MRSLAILPAMIAMPAVASAAPMLVCTSTAPSAELVALIDAYHHASAASDRHHFEVYEPAHKAWKEAIEAIPHCKTVATYTYLGEPQRMSTANPSHVSAAKFAASSKPGSLYSAEYETACAELLKRMKQRDAKRAKITARYDVIALAAESDRLAEVRDHAIDAVERFPAATISDVIAKAQMVADETDGTFNIDILLADLRRIAGEAVA
ncbi:hypothetical protein [Sphingobium xenophagum]|uniref:hypothetical protein n=1 Tax=Sphingobium xenophagum TaxID=121428 RepID=UPI0002FF0C1E|nr:hypothetical protein [Sphingobium xenophagum]